MKEGQKEQEENNGRKTERWRATVMFLLHRVRAAYRSTCFSMNVENFLGEMRKRPIRTSINFSVFKYAVF